MSPTESVHESVYESVQSLCMSLSGARALAVNCFFAAVLMGLEGYGLPIPLEVVRHLSAGERHEALWGLLRDREEETRERELANAKEVETLDSMIGELAAWRVRMGRGLDVFGGSVRAERDRKCHHGSHSDGGADCEQLCR